MLIVTMAVIISYSEIAPLNGLEAKNRRFYVGGYKE